MGKEEKCEEIAFMCSLFLLCGLDVLVLTCGLAAFVAVC